MVENVKLPPRIVDSHHHFLDTDKPHSSFLRSLAGPGRKYLPQDYTNDVKTPLAASSVSLSGTVHMETLPDNPYGGPEEVAWVQSFISTGYSDVKAIVGSCDIGDEATVKECLQKLKQASPLVRGVRWIVDHVGSYDGKSATHVATKRRDVDYLRGNDGSTVESFEKGFALLEEYGWSFDLQCAPAQLPAAAELISRYPNVSVVIDHLGKPLFPSESDENIEAKENDVTVEWRRGMQAMANLPNVYVKISMLGYILPDWSLDKVKEAKIRSLVRETVKMFGPKRSMMALNWYIDASVSDNDNKGTVGPSPKEFVEYLSSWLEDYSEEDKDWIFAKTAETFYKIN